MITFLTVIHISAIVLLVIAVLLQSGKGAEISANFGGSSQTVFGSSGGANFLAAVFMVTSLTLTVLPGKMKKSVFEGYTAPGTTTPAQPAAPAEGNNAIPAQQATEAKTVGTKNAETPLGAVHSKNNGGTTVDSKATNTEAGKTVPAAPKSEEKK